MTARSGGVWLDLRAQARARMAHVEAPEGMRAAAAATWLGRMVNEHGSATVFEGLAEDLRAAGADAALVDECFKMADEERLHGVLCGSVVEALGGEARTLVREPQALPKHPDVDRLEAALRNVMSVCCLSETVAVSIIGAERLQMAAGDPRTILTKILSDEIGHARFGWKWIASVAPSLDAATRARLGEYLALAFAHLERHELDHLPDHGAPPAAGVAIGLCDGGEARELFYDTIEQIIVPQLEAHGIPARAAWESRALDVAA